MHSVAVFCGSSAGSDPRFADAARRVGTHLARTNRTLIYGGGSVGLMGICADAALAAAGQVVGVIPRAMVEAERGHKGLTELHIVDTMHQRKALMADRATAFVALPGGFGTFDELLEIVTWAQLGYHPKPIGLLNVAGFYSPLVDFLDRVVEAGFIQPRFRAMVNIHDDFEHLLSIMSRYQPPTGAGFARPSER